MPISLAVRKPPSELVPGKPGFRLCVGFEGLHLTAYPDPASRRGRALAMKPHERPAGWETFPGDPWTIGYGHTEGVSEGDTCTLAQADAWLAEDLAKAAAIVRSQITVPLTPGEFDALVSVAYNLGYIPKSMKACLNGGVTDKGVQMAPGSYGSALQQFPRNCRAAGVPMRGLLRRRLAEACVFSDLPWEAACSKNIVKLELDAKGNPDPTGTTSLEETLARARQDIPFQRPDPTSILTKPWSEIVPATPAPPPAPSVIVAETLPGVPEKPIAVPETEDAIDIPASALPELTLDQIAPAPAPKADKGDVASPATQPARPRSSTPTESPPASPGGATQAGGVPRPPVSPVGQATATPTAPPAAQAPSPVPKLLPPAEPPPSPQQQRDGVNGSNTPGIDPSSAKSMLLSRRFWGLFMVISGRVVFAIWGTDTLLKLGSDPLVSEMVANVAVMMAASAWEYCGEMIHTWGKARAKRPLR